MKEHNPPRKKQLKYTLWDTKWRTKKDKMKLKIKPKGKLKQNSKKYNEINIMNQYNESNEVSKRNTKT